jgi:hypothetical protein
MKDYINMDTTTPAPVSNLEMCVFIILEVNGTYSTPKRSDTTISSFDNEGPLLPNLTSLQRDYRIEVEEPRTPTLADFAISSTAMEAIERMSNLLYI